MSFPKYPAYKDSGVEWIGEIPVGWSIKPFWTLFRRVKRNGHAEKELLSVYRDYGVIPKSSRDDNFNKPSDDLAAYQLVEKNDLVINKMKAWQGSCAVSDFEGIVSPAYFVFSSTSNNFWKFLHYLFRCNLYTSYYYSISKGVRPNQWDLDPETHSRMAVILPSLPEQKAIASFLDRECGKIDALIAEQERLIALLAEKRQAVISHAVTKGLNPNAPMKDSGIPWIGVVPEGWDVVTAGRVVRVISGFAFPSDKFLKYGEGVPLLRGVNVGVGKLRWDDVVYWKRQIDDGLDIYELKEGDIVIGMDRPWISSGLRACLKSHG
ncbi:restriction endonuclease S subunit [Acetobacter orleanensis NRIC 0473]|uniref:restriction endonuclease subunit S n=1 Tax=Acetobacter orleanensis TaxID=104099 RepID=UPI0005E3EF52|nr:restriction endonuclease subunit S [Acetobacter orleanensis]GAN69920.1 type I restriction-modification system specificity determinant protein [Acetobacter orleanensis JCM 7639]GBR30944.1 restriction endonuclease S subunit [Acetobacter orleanensis NRIC 0473]